MYHIFSILSSVEGYLGCFQVLAIKNNSAMNIAEHNKDLLIGKDQTEMYEELRKYKDDLAKKAFGFIRLDAVHAR